MIPVAATALLGGLIAMFLKREAGEIALLLSLAQQASISDALLTPMLKVLGIEVVTNLAAHICKDAGEGGIASTVELAGAICALYASIPVIQAVLILIEELL